jgi:hypothetical protein
MSTQPSLIPVGMSLSLSAEQGKLSIVERKDLTLKIGGYFCLGTHTEVLNRSVNQRSAIS